VRALAAMGKTVFAAAGERLYRSTDSGASWEEYAAFANFGEIRALQFTGDGVLLVGTASGLFRLGSVKAKELAEPVEAIYAWPGGEILARTESGSFVSNKNGAEWKKFNFPDGSSLADAVISCTGQFLIATTQGIWRPPDTMGNPPEPARGIPGGTVSAVAFHPVRCQEAYAAQFGVVYVSRDGGTTWSAFGTPIGSIQKLWIEKSAPNQLFAIVRGQGVFVWNLN